MTADEARALIRKHGSKRAVAREAHISADRLRRALQTDDAGPALRVAPANGGFRIEGKALLAKRPTDVWGPRFRSLRSGLGYYPKTLAVEWGCGEATVRDHARAAGALRYTEIGGSYVEVVVHPDTRSGK